MHIKINTEIPNQNDVEFYNKFKKYEARSMHGQLPVVWERAEDFCIYDKWGNTFLDFTSTICVTNSGHGNIFIRAAIKHILDKPLLHTYTFPSVVRHACLKTIVDRCYPGGKAFLLSSGTEATECAVKLMIMNGLKQKELKNDIISFKGAMHGRTKLAENLKGETGDNEWAKGRGDKNNIYHLDFPNENNNFIEDLEKSLKLDGVYDINTYSKNFICGIILEAYQGWSGAFYPDKYIKDLMEWAKKNNVLVCFDEIQGGFGRTGKMFVHQHYDITPDLICVGKALSGSLPVSAVIGRGDILDIPEEGSMSSTHSANPLACASVLGNLKRLTPLFIESEKKGHIMLGFLNRINRNIKINGWGLLCGIVTETKEQADKIVWNCFKRGLLLIWTHKNSVKIAPPLTITEDALMEGLEILKEEIERCIPQTT